MLIFPEAVPQQPRWIKVCGFTEMSPILKCHEIGVSAIGLNFWSGSKRFVKPEIAASWVPLLPEQLVRIGVFVNAEQRLIFDLLDRGVIHAAQLHGDESAAECAALNRRGFPVIKAIGIRDLQSLARLDDYEVDAFVLDAFAPDRYGGTGKVFDWLLAEEAVRRRPDVRIILSGGLSPENVKEAVDRVLPYGVDVASGVETEGRKDPEKVKKFVMALL